MTLDALQQRLVIPPRLRPILERNAAGLWMILLWLALFLTLGLEVRPANESLQVGTVSTRTVRAPERLMYRSVVLTDRAREAAAEAVEQLYSPPDRSQAIRQTSTAQAMARYIDTIRADPYADTAQKTAYVLAMQPVQFAPAQIRTMLTLPEPQWQVTISETVRLVDTQMRGEVRESRLDEILASLSAQVSVELDDAQADVVAVWAGGLIVPNALLDTERTAQARAAARAAVEATDVTYEAGQVILREGEVITEEQIEALQRFGLFQPSRTVEEVVGLALFLALLVVAFAAYLYRQHADYFRDARLMGLFVILLATLAFTIRLVMPDHRFISYFLPTPAVAMLIGVLLGIDMALVFTIIIALIVGFLTNSMEFVTYTFVGGLVAPLLLGRVERLATFVWTGAVVGLVNMVVVFAFAYPTGLMNPLDMAATSGAAMVNGAASASLALGGFYVVSHFLGIMTFLQLLELSRPTHPLFHELLNKAPGTYHHSIVVGNLAEAAAEAIGADMLLVRVAAYYHDVGKIENAHYFIENQTSGINTLDELNDPYQSAEIIKRHVTDGLKLAKAHRLPRRIQDFIEQHHGTSIIRYFYGKAVERDGAGVDDADFRYPGVKPQSREAGILMLADTLEAAIRAGKPVGREAMDNKIDLLIREKVRDKQLDHCDLTMDELTRCREAFKKVLHSIYHPRVAYPDIAVPQTSSHFEGSAEEEDYYAPAPLSVEGE